MSDPTRDVVELSLVIPAYNERDNVVPLLAELRTALGAIGRRYEIVFVDDGSDDGTGAILAAEAKRDAHVHPMFLSERVGQSAALVAGIARARGSVIVTLDADLQNDPSDLPCVLSALENADVVSGIRRNRNDSWLRRVSSQVANRVRRAVIGDSVTDIGCSFKAYRREALENLPTFVGLHRFLPTRCVQVRRLESPLARDLRSHWRLLAQVSFDPPPHS